MDVGRYSAAGEVSIEHAVVPAADRAIEAGCFSSGVPATT
jgi:hypothetical protein